MTRFKAQPMLNGSPDPNREPRYFLAEDYRSVKQQLIDRGLDANTYAITKLLTFRGAM